MDLTSAEIITVDSLGSLHSPENPIEGQCDCNCDCGGVCECPQD